jgi:hypothetical protein
MLADYIKNDPDEVICDIYRILAPRDGVRARPFLPGQDTLLANDAARDANVTHWCTLALFDSSYRRTVGERPAVQELLSLAQRGSATSASGGSSL